MGLALTVLAVGATGALAQQTTGTITGRVMDPQGLIAPGSTIRFQTVPLWSRRL
jgi:hypothetical protein